MKMKVRRTGVAACAAIAVSLSIVACSSSSGQAGPAGSKSSSAKIAGTTATKSPIKVGFIDPNSGPAPYKTVKYGRKGGLRYVNKIIGGVNGHPLKLSVCNSDGTPEKNVSCANRFVQEHVVAVVDGYAAAAGAEAPILKRAGIPITGVVAGNDTLNTASNAYYFGPAHQAFAVGPLQVLHKAGVNKMALTIADVPAGHAYVKKYVDPAAKDLGMQVSTFYYPANNPNWSVIATTLTSKNAGLVGVIAAPETQCTALLKAVQRTGWNKKILLGGCQDFVKKVGKSQAAGVYSYSATWLSSMRKYAPPVIQRQIDAYHRTMAAIGHADVKDQRAISGFADLVDLAKRMRDAKTPITAKSVTTAFAKTKNFQTFMGPVVTCTPPPWQHSSSCTDTVLITKVRPDGSIKPAGGKGFVKLDTTVLN
jgi:branched-chain amino acid transport system substrate-binding protein